MQQPSKMPRAVIAVVSLCCLQVIYLVITTLTGLWRAESSSAVAVSAAFYFLITAALGAGALALLQGKRFGFPLVLVWQLFAVILSVQLMLSGVYLLGGLSLAVSAMVVLLLFSRAVLEHIKPI